MKMERMMVLLEIYGGCSDMPLPWKQVKGVIPEE